MPKGSTTNNDYAVARELNERANHLIILVTEISRLYNTDEPYSEYAESVKPLNRPYVLVVHELEKLYANNEALSKLSDDPKTKPTWTVFNAIESNDLNINDYCNKHKNQEDFTHIAQLNRLAIIADSETPNFTPQQQKIVDEADKIIGALVDRLHEKEAGRPKKNRVDEYYISKFTLNYADNGNIVINGVLILKKTQNGSAPRKLMEQAVKHPNELFKPELGQLTRNFSSVLGDMGIIGTLKELFFPIAHKDGVLFRPEVHRRTADEERIDTNELEKQLKKLGAEKKHIFEYDYDLPESDEPISEEMRALLAQHEETRPILEEYERNEKERKNP